VSSRNADSLAYSLWSLLPSFCNYPSDTAKSFKDLERHLRNTLKEEPDIRGIICTSLQLLIRQNKNIKDSNDKDDIGQDMAKEQVLVNYSQQVATENLRALEISAKNLLKDLSDVFLKSTKDDGGCLQVLFLQCTIVEPIVHACSHNIKLEFAVLFMSLFFSCCARMCYAILKLSIALVSAFIIQILPCIIISFTHGILIG